jgi:pilus assembly protein Flp/PilA
VIESQKAIAMSKYVRRSIIPPLARFLCDDSGATAIEYAMIASGIAVAIAATVVSLGSNVQGLYSNVASAMK